LSKNRHRNNPPPHGGKKGGSDRSVPLLNNPSEQNTVHVVFLVRGITDDRGKTHFDSYWIGYNAWTDKVGLRAQSFHSRLQDHIDKNIAIGKRYLVLHEEEGYSVNEDGIIMREGKVEGRLLDWEKTYQKPSVVV
jgi:hypothetical protein